VDIQLNVRGICMLVPGVEGMSENIRVVSIVDRYLEHSRIFYFANQGQDEIYLSSADWMPRNLEKRVELMFPVESPVLKKRLVRALKAFLKANVKARELIPDGIYVPVEKKGKKPFRAQEYFYRRRKKAVEEASDSPQREFTVRRTSHAT
jgi:polyphosphate kinase